MKYPELQNKYQSDAGFNKMVNLFRQLIEEYQFQPSEIREGLFFAQYTYQMNHVTEIIRTIDDLEKIEQLRRLQRDLFTQANSILKEPS